MTIGRPGSNPGPGAIMFVRCRWREHLQPIGMYRTSGSLPFLVQQSFPFALGLVSLRCLLPCQKRLNTAVLCEPNLDGEPRRGARSPAARYGLARAPLYRKRPIRRAECRRQSSQPAARLAVVAMKIRLGGLLVAIGFS